MAAHNSGDRDLRTLDFTAFNTKRGETVFICIIDICPDMLKGIDKRIDRPHTKSVGTGNDEFPGTKGTESGKETKGGAGILYINGNYLAGFCFQYLLQCGM